MMTDTLELSSFFEQNDWTPERLEAYADATHASFSACERFESLLKDYRERVAAGSGDPLRLAIGYLILGRYADALAQFEQAPASRERHYYAAQAAVALRRLDVARENFRQAARLGWDALDVDMRLADVHLRAGDLDTAEKLVRQHQSAGQDRAAWHLAAGLLAEARNDRAGALAAFEKCLTLDPDHTDAMFHSARLHDLCGLDEQALELYGRLALQPRAHVNALLNAAVIYEDFGRYDEATAALRRVLRAFPNHARARLFLKDVESCRQMVVDEVRETPVDARERLLGTPLSEFDLSVRARNCLKKMNIRTLGDMIRLTEAELLAYKNFGETSLTEIKALLARKGLHLGMNPDEIDLDAIEEQEVVKPPPVPPGQVAVLAKPVSELELSVRARRCLQRLNVVTLGDLIQYTEAELLATRNFGVTSLNEVKARLADHGLQLSAKKAD